MSPGNLDGVFPELVGNVSPYSFCRHCRHLVDFLLMVAGWSLACGCTRSHRAARKPPPEIVERRFWDGLTDGAEPSLKAGVHLACRQPVHGALDGQLALLFGDVELQLLTRFHRRER